MSQTSNPTFTEHLFEVPELKTQPIGEFMAAAVYGRRASHPLSGIENLMYAVSDRMLPDYRGGQWEAVSIIPKKGEPSPWFWMLDSDPSEVITIKNAFSEERVELPAFLAYGVVTVIAINQFLIQCVRVNSDEAEMGRLADIHHELIGALYAAAEVIDADGRWQSALFTLLD